MELDKKYQSILGIVIGFLILYVLFNSKVLLYIPMILGLSALLFKPAAAIIERAWMFIVKLIGFINSYVLLSIIFFLFLFPIAFLYRLFKGDTIMLKNKANSFFKERNHVYSKKDLMNPW